MAAALEPKPDALAPKPPLLMSSEETPVYLEAFALACVACHVEQKLKLLNRQSFKPPKWGAGSQHTAKLRDRFWGCTPEMHCNLQGLPLSSIGGLTV